MKRTGTICWPNTIISMDYQVSSYNLGCIRLPNYTSVKLRFNWLLVILDKLPLSSTHSKVEAKMVSSGGYIVKLSCREFYFLTITGKTSLSSSGQLRLNFAYYSRIHIVDKPLVYFNSYLLPKVHLAKIICWIPKISMKLLTQQKHLHDMLIIVIITIKMYLLCIPFRYNHKTKRKT